VSLLGIICAVFVIGGVGTLIGILIALADEE
jgi:hypothetical protein